MSRGKQKWNEFEKQYQVEQTIYQLTLESLQILKDKLRDELISAFAFCVDSYSGNLSLSYNVYDGEYSGEELKENEFFPPDWTDEEERKLNEMREQYKQ